MLKTGTELPQLQPTQLHLPGNDHSATLPDKAKLFPSAPLDDSFQNCLCSQTYYLYFSWASSVKKMKPWIQPVWILLHRSCVWNGVTKPVTESKNKSYLWTLVRSLTTHVFSLHLLQPVSAVSSLFAMHLWLWEFLCRNLPQLKISVTSLLGILLKIKIYLTISVFLHHGWCCEMC